MKIISFDSVSFYIGVFAILGIDHDHRAYAYVHSCILCAINSVL